MAASFYTHALNTETYDLGLGRGGSSRSDIPFYVELAREAGSTVLELACGTGQVTLALAQAGYIVTGLDRSSAMLRVARDKLDRTDPEIVRRVHFLQEDMASFELGTEFDAIFIPFRSFQFLLTTEAQRACLDRVSRHLRPGARSLPSCSTRSSTCASQTSAASRGPTKSSTQRQDRGFEW